MSRNSSARKAQARAAEREHRQRQRRRRKAVRTAIPVVLGLAILAVGYAWYAKTRPAPVIAGVEGPRLKVDRDRIDFGYQHLGHMVRAEFNVTNAGDGTLQLQTPPVATLLDGC